jgi:MFS superfamily sulfate permease-like transporter/CRP-like cAMP-binding protein
MKCSIEVATGGSFYECSELFPESENSAVLEVFNLSSGIAPVSVNGSYECSLMVEAAPVPDTLSGKCGFSKMLLTWDYGWKFLWPALPIGVPMYILKRYHIGSPRNWMPAFIIVPNVIFYMFLGAEGLLDGLTPVESMVGCGKVSPSCPHGNYNWFFPSSSSHDFREPYAKWDNQKIRWDAVMSTMPVLILMTIIVSIDVLLKLAGTEKQLQVSLNMNREMLVSGAGTLLNTAFFGAPGYAQTKFSVINFAIVRDASNRVPAVCCALFNAAMYFSGFPLINYLPRFFLSGLLIFAGAGFVVENLYDARETLSPLEFGAVWIIVTTNAFYGLLPAVVVGIILSSLIFAVKYSQTPVLKHIVTGRDYQSKVIRTHHLDWKLQQLGNQILIMRLQGFIFFGTASKLQDRVQELFDLRDQWTADVGVKNPPEVNEAHAVRYLILDFESVSDLDSTGVFAFTKLIRLCKERDIMLLFTEMLPGIKTKLIEKYQVVPESIYMPNLDDAFEYCEELMLEWAAGVRSLWYRAECIERIHRGRMFAKALHASALADLFPRGTVSITQMLKYCQRATLPAKSVLMREGERRREMFIMQAGRIKCFASNGRENLLDRHVSTITSGSFLNEEGLFMGIISEVTAVVEEEATVITLDADNFATMQIDDPDIAIAVQSAVIRSVATSRDRLQREMRAVLGREERQEESDRAEAQRAAEESDMLQKANEILHGFHVERLEPRELLGGSVPVDRRGTVDMHGTMLSPTDNPLGGSGDIEKQGAEEGEGGDLI